MAFRGRSVAKGPCPRWLRSASDIRFIDHEGDDETALLFEAPTLGEAAPELYQQQEFWSTRPDASLTGLDLFGDVVRDVADHNEDDGRNDKNQRGSTGFKNVPDDLRFRSGPARLALASADGGH